MTLIDLLQEAGQDHEFYPTTSEILRALQADILRYKESSYSSLTSVLDIGAGDGKVLSFLKTADLGFSELYAIEKSEILCQRLPPEVFIVGTEFAEQSLLTKPVDVIFCNPPYSRYEEWATKIIRQAAAHLLYLVIPCRWAKSSQIADALKFRGVGADIVGSFDFLDSEDREARAKVDLIRVRFRADKKDAPFEKFFQEQFSDLIRKFDSAAQPEDGRPAPKARFAGLVVGPTYPETLANLYDQEMANVRANYQLVGQLDAELLRELAISPEKIMGFLKQRLAGLRHTFWHELFDRLDTITSRLTSKSRQSLLDTLHRHVEVDFTLSNIFAIIIWSLKNANLFLEKQFIDTYDEMVARCNIVNYASNRRAWIEERWRYNREERKNSHFALDYRIVIHSVGGIETRWNTARGLEERAAIFLGDLMTLANNLGFRCDPNQNRLASYQERERWKSNQLETFSYVKPNGVPDTLFDVRAFRNGNLHIRFNKRFILALNVEHGRINGWLRDAKEAVTELRDPNAAIYFGCNHRLPTSPQLLLAA